MNNPLLLLHGAIGAKSQIEPWLPTLSESFEVHTFNFEGHGDTPSPNRPFRIEQFAENILDYLQANQIEKADIFGYSMGGYVALYFASIYPDRVGNIFTFASKLAWNPETSAKEVKMLNPDAIEAKVPAFAQALADRHSGMGWKANLAATAEMMVHLGNSPTITPELLRSLPQTILMGLGDRDNMVTLTETVEAFKHVEKGSLLVLPNTHHPIEKIHFPQLLPHILLFFGSNSFPQQ